MPVTQLNVPVWHGLAGVHALTTQSLLQSPLTHSAFVPHRVPLG
jgi:hypothetical protein